MTGAGTRRRAVVAAAIALLVAAMAAPALASGGPARSAAGVEHPAAHAAGAARTEPGHELRRGNRAGCDDFDPSQCLLPFPSDWQTRPDSTSRTGRRVDLRLGAMPRNALGLPIRPVEYDRLDGFSPGQTIVVHVPGLDNEKALARTGAVTVRHIGRYRAAEAPIVVIDAATGKRWPIWAEVDANAGSPAHTNLLIHPAVNFRTDTRYIVALRSLKRANGTTIPAPAAFAVYRDGSAPTTGRRTAHMNEVFADLATAHIPRRNLYLAWDFTVASQHAISGRLLSMRNRAFAELGDTDLSDLKVTGRSPRFTVHSYRDLSKADDPRVGRRVTLDVTVPCFIWPTCSIPALHLDAGLPLSTTLGRIARVLGIDLSPLIGKLPVDGVPPGIGTGHFLLKHPFDPGSMPRQNPLPLHARVICNIPRVAIDGGKPARPSLYGHGLFGSATEVDTGNVTQFGADHDIMFCAPDWFGMAKADIPNALLALLDLSNFPLLVDRVQQGILDFLYVGRAMIHPDGFCSSPAFRANGRCVINTDRLYYDGNSQGGIEGGTVVAVEPDLTRGVLGVTGMDYSELLYRSSDFVSSGPLQPSYVTPFQLAYRNTAARPLILSLIQMLWDRSDPDGYAARMTTHPLPDTPAHHVLLQVGFGDHQVANITAADEARTIGAALLSPALDRQRRAEQPGRTYYWNLPRITARKAPYDGSAMTVFDIGPLRDHGAKGTGPPPVTDTAPPNGVDPHEAPRRTLCGNLQKSAFLRPHGKVVAPCGGPPYFAFGYRGAKNAGPGD
jgi:hypothetical protein